MSLPTLTVLAQWAGITMPTLYAGITFQYSLTMSLLAHTFPPSAPNSKLLAKQWLALYQQGPYWVPPLIHTGLLANLYLAASSSTTSSCSFRLYLAAAALTLSILPITFFYLEPGINGACKWKVERLLRKEEEEEEGGEFRLPAARVWWFKASVVRHSASEASKRWAEVAEMRELVLAWARRNHGRWVVAGLAGALSFVATLGGGKEEGL
ncbi:hypothetical protein C8A03DRAFT_17281 [Achaetomium macrosporum]|uniref:Uncharacterized protein n=1 Tax=Achaetomium macrosporum TaxID=79813 RepID=A0AAN7C5Y8_9PEZI|nr:hypothetical protein C8A03DRAFT_17281 [Achaetomium macrosporum]